MNLRKTALFAVLPAVAVAGTYTSDADACGGCFVQQSENTQVSGHRMVLSVSPAETTLWDQITYDGDPTEFAWVLPTRGEVEVGVSSDLLFAQLEANTEVIVNSPQINCGSNSCPSNDGAQSAGDGTGGGGGLGGGVTVIAQEVVGPFETVQLLAEDPDALNTWLVDHGYAIPQDIQPIISSYVNEGFGFLALRLVPGQGVESMRPIRVTSPGAVPTLPLRMVAAGTGARTPISLWVIGEGRYEPTNFDSFVIEADELIWDWDAASSNYATLRESKFAASGNTAWQIEASEQTGAWPFNSLTDTASYDPEGSGYGDGDAISAVEEAEEDIQKLIGNIPSDQVWITRMFADLGRSALSDDLQIGASLSQIPVERWLQVETAVGTPPACPPPPDCGDLGGTGGMGGILNFGDGNALGSSSCTMGTTGNTATLFATLAALGLVVGRRRRK